MGGGCMAAGEAPVVISHVGAAMTTTEVGTGLKVTLLWPSGFTAWLVDGEAVLLASDGAEVAREGGPAIEDIGGGLSADGLFHVCAIVMKTY
jgi:hypothetical protein